MNSASIWIAGYASIVATAALSWQIWTNWPHKRQRLSLKFDPYITIKTYDEFVVLHCLALDLDEPQKYQNYLDAIEWDFEVSLTNAGRSRIQVTGLQILQRTSMDTFNWNAASRVTNLWLEPKETRKLQFTKGEIKNASLVDDLEIIVDVSPRNRFRIQGRLLTISTPMKMRLSMSEAREFLTKSGLDKYSEPLIWFRNIGDNSPKQ